MVERSFADALGLHIGDVLTLNNRKFRVVGTAVTAAIPPFPQACSDGCNLNLPQLSSSNTGLIWVNEAEVHRLATTAEPVSYILNLKLANPNEVDAFCTDMETTIRPAPRHLWTLGRTSANRMAI